MDSAELLISPRSAVTSIQNMERAKIGVLQTDSLASFHAQRAALLKASNIDIVESEAQVCSNSLVYWHSSYCLLI